MTPELHPISKAFNRFNLCRNRPWHHERAEFPIVLGRIFGIYEISHVPSPRRSLR
jgi:hypothetical protein